VPKPKTVAEYFAAVPKDKRAALKDLRRIIKAADPKAVETLAYGLLGFKHRGRPLVYIGYAKDHCGLYGGSVARFTTELKTYDVSKGTVRFTPARPLPARLVKKIVKARIAEIDKPD
jgi:uncharacterized protein YdhG (YjbR/CyaY superfamily)